MKLTPVVLCLAASFAPIMTKAHAANVVVMSITGGSFNSGGSAGTPNPWSGYSVTNISGGDQTFGSPFSFFGVPVYVFNSNEGAGNTYAPYQCGVTATCGSGALTGAPVIGGDAASISATVVGNTITADLSGWTMFWNGVYNAQGVPSVTGTINGAGQYTLSWHAQVVGGPFNGSTNNWTITGVAAVPEPSTYGMMVVGLGLVVGATVQRRKLR